MRTGSSRSSRRDNCGYLFRARHNGQELATAGDLWTYGDYGPQEPRPAAQTVFFTDRAIYRPGQMIQYKGICLWVDQSKDNYEVLKGEQLTVVFKDVNGKEVARQKQRANDYGSFAGSFTAPRDRLMGQMSLQVEGRAQGAAYFRVEEYKRPEVRGDARRAEDRGQAQREGQPHRPRDELHRRGGGRRRGQIPRRARGANAVVVGLVAAAAGPRAKARKSPTARPGPATDGSFKIEFAARPDPKVPEKDEPTFVFQINADVTDSAGETRSADRAIRVGYTALEAMISADDWQTDGKPVELKVETKTLDGEPQVAEGSVKIYDLQAPDRVHRRPANQPGAVALRR